MSRNPFLVDTDWLFAHLDDDSVAIVDASWYLPAMNRDGRAEYDAQHIPGAVFFDIDDIVDPQSDLPHTLASPEIFARKVGALGISHDQTIVIYDGHGLFSAPRVWWNFRVMGATKVVILDGGLPRWIEDRLPIEAGSAPLYPKLFTPQFDAQAVTDFSAMQTAVAQGQSTILDARPHARFTGEAAEPRAGMRSGHMPGATSLPMTDLAPDGRLLDRQELEKVLRDKGVDPNKPTITTCGSGVTAALLTLALETVGHRDHSLYDGSWSQWGGRDDTDVATGT